MSERDRDPLARLYDVADDHETAVLDALRNKAGLTWECACEPCGWTNPEDAARCDRCGAARDAHAVSFEPDAQYPHLVRPSCACGWSKSGYVKARLAAEFHAAHVAQAS